MKLVSMLVEIRCHKQSEKTWCASMSVKEAFELLHMEGFAGMIVKMVPVYEEVCVGVISRTFSR